MIRPTDERIEEVSERAIAAYNNAFGLDDITIGRRDFCTMMSCLRVVKETTEPSGEFIVAGTTTVKGRENE